MRIQTSVTDDFVVISFDVDEGYHKYYLDIQDAKKLIDDLNESYKTYFNCEKTDKVKQLSDKKAEEIKELVSVYENWLHGCNNHSKLLMAMYEFIVMQHFKKDQS